MAETSALLALPPELRLRIYEHVLPADDGSSVNVHRPMPSYFERRPGSSRQPALLSTNRQIRREVFPIVYRSCSVKGYLNNILAWLTASPFKAALVQEIIVWCPIGSHNATVIHRQRTQEPFSTSRAWKISLPCLLDSVTGTACTETESERCYSHAKRVDAFARVANDMAAADTKIFRCEDLTGDDHLAALKRHLVTMDCSLEAC